jgi:uncharacterized protein (TIGR03067 family)
MMIYTAIALSILCVDDSGFDVASLAGEWEVVSVEENGKAVPLKEVEERGERYLKIRNDTFVRFSNRMSATATFRLDDSRDPHEITLKWSTGPLAMWQSTGIFRLEDGQFVICVAHPSARRPPVAFSTDLEEPYALYTYRKRVFRR